MTARPNSKETLNKIEELQAGIASEINSQFQRAS
jgi:hypothetical protein